MLAYATNGYNPIQPAFENNTVDYVEKYIPSKTDEYLNLLFYQFSLQDGTSDKLSLVPDLCIDIVFVCNPNKPKGYLCGSLSECKDVLFQTGYDYFGVRLLPEHSIMDTQFLLGQLMDNKIPFSEIWNHRIEIVDAIANASSFQERISIVEQEIIPHLSELKHFSLIVSYCMRKLYESNGQISINALAEEVGYSERYIRKNFEKFIGVSPKLVARIIRFQQALKLIGTSSSNMLDIVEQCGYYDYSHLFYELKEFNFNFRYLKGQEEK